jgi:AcrR family transcriptional regulator
MRERKTESDTRTPVQKRSMRTREKILKAAQRLFAQKGYHGVNSNEIAAAAGVSTGSFYAYFTDKKSLFLETMRRYNHDVLEHIMQSTDSGVKGAIADDRRGLVRSVVLRAIAAHDYSPAFHREMTAMMYSDAEVLALQSAEDGNILRALAGVLDAGAGDLRIRDPKTAAFVIYRSVEGVVHHLRMLERPPDQDVIIDEMTDMLCRYLFNDALPSQSGRTRRKGC